MAIEDKQRQIATLQKQIKQISDKVKSEDDPKRKSVMQKKMVDLNFQKNTLMAELEDEISSIDVDAELDLGESFNRKRKLKLSLRESRLLNSVAKLMTEEENINKAKLSKAMVTANKIVNMLIDMGKLKSSDKNLELLQKMMYIIAKG